jgi:FtsP/CotA-like multicopper oxidase with cupredoxin domain
MLTLIVGQFPGPTIEARSGDELVIDVHNSIQDSDNDGIAIHWHGLSMKGMRFFNTSMKRHSPR